MHVLEDEQERILLAAGFEQAEQRVERPVLLLLRREVQRRIAIVEWNRQKCSQQRNEGFALVRQKPADQRLEPVQSFRRGRVAGEAGQILQMTNDRVPGAGRVKRRTLNA